MTDQTDPVFGSEPVLSQTRVALQVIGIILAVAAALWMLQQLERVFLLLMLATLLAYVVDPLVQLGERPVWIGGRSRRLARGPAIALVYVLVTGLACGAVMLLLPTIADQVDDIAARAPVYTQSILTWEHGWARYYQRLRIPGGLRQTIDQSVVATSAAALEYARQSVLAVAGALSHIPFLLLIPILGFFLLKDGASLRRMLVRALPQRGRWRSHKLVEELNSTLAAYTRAQLLACVLVGTLSGIGFAVIGIPYAALLGVLAGVLELIPLVGPFALAVVAALVGALHAPMLAVWAVGFLAVLRVVEDYVMYPRLLRRSVHLHPLAVILAVLAGSELDGVAGMFLAIPVVAVGSVAVRHWLEWRADDALERSLGGCSRCWVHAAGMSVPRCRSAGPGDG